MQSERFLPRLLFFRMIIIVQQVCRYAHESALDSYRGNPHKRHQAEWQPMSSLQPYCWHKVDERLLHQSAAGIVYNLRIVSGH